MTFEEIFAQVDGINGWMSKEDCSVLNKYASRMERAKMVEIGSFLGRSTKVLLLSSPTSKVVSVDPYADNYQYAKDSPFIVINIPPDDAFNQINNNLREFGNWKLVRERAHNVGKEWKENIDFLFIDGDHSYEHVSQDIADWVPGVKSGGYVLFHDYESPAFPGIAQAISEVKEKYFGEVVKEEQIGIGIKK